MNTRMNSHVFYHVIALALAVAIGVVFYRPQQKEKELLGHLGVLTSIVGKQTDILAVTSGRLIKLEERVMNLEVSVIHFETLRQQNRK
jgi:hypothetical protein